MPAEGGGPSRRGVRPEATDRDAEAVQRSKGWRGGHKDRRKPGRAVRRGGARGTGQEGSKGTTRQGQGPQRRR
jgi:hypothetical protein